jgi:hypothetical protein
MKYYIRTIAALAVSWMVSSVVPTLKADEFDKKTYITIDHSIGVQGNVLTPGSYVLKLLGSSSDRYTVQIFNAAENHVIATIFATPAYRLEDTADSQFSFYDAVDGQPPALRKWFYPGENVGFEFELGRGAVATESGKRHSNAPTTKAGGD